MNKVGLHLAVAIACIFAAQAVAGQEQKPPPKTAWTVSTTPSKGKPKGYVQYENYCSVCHGEGVGKPGTMALQAKYKGALPALLEKRTDLTPEMIRTYVRHGFSVMPIFRKTEISDADLDAIVAYLTRNNKK
jgi:mono/diheme cytochrome c family protein